MGNIISERPFNFLASICTRIFQLLHSTRSIKWRCIFGAPLLCQILIHKFLGSRGRSANRSISRVTSVWFFLINFKIVGKDDREYTVQEKGFIRYGLNGNAWFYENVWNFIISSGRKIWRRKVQIFHCFNDIAITPNSSVTFSSTSANIHKSK